MRIMRSGSCYRSHKLNSQIPVRSDKPTRQSGFCLQAMTVTAQSEEHDLSDFAEVRKPRDSKIHPMM